MGRLCFGWPKQSDWLSNCCCCCLSLCVVACVVFFWHSLPEQARTTSERMNGIDGAVELLCPQHINKSRQKARQKRLPLSLLASLLTLKCSRRCLCCLTGGPSSLSSTVPITRRPSPISRRGTVRPSVLATLTAASLPIRIRIPRQGR